MLENIISEINLINIDDNINYLKRNDGILIKGFINLDCEYLSLGVIRKFNDKVDVSILVPYENVETSELKFKFLDFDYFIKENILSLSFKINIEGYKEIEKSFQDETQEVEIVSNVDVTMQEIQKIVNNDNEIIELEDIDQINELIDNKLDLKIDDVEEDSKIIPIDSINESEGRMIEFNINGELKEKEVVKKETWFDTIFKKDKKIKMWKYRVILENDSYEEIAKEYNVNLYKLKEINQNSLLEIGKIIKIPNYNE